MNGGTFCRILRTSIQTGRSSQPHRLSDSLSKRLAVTRSNSRTSSMGTAPAASISPGHGSSASSANLRNLSTSTVRRFQSAIAFWGDRRGPVLAWQFGQTTSTIPRTPNTFASCPQNGQGFNSSLILHPSRIPCHTPCHSTHRRGDRPHPRRSCRARRTR